MPTHPDCLRGTIKAVYPEKAFGFIRGDLRDEHGKPIDYFFHKSQLQVSTGVLFDQLIIGDPVEFLVVEHPKGLRAIEVRQLRPTPLPEIDEEEDVV